MKKLMACVFALALTAGVAMAGEDAAGAAGGGKNKGVEKGRAGGLAALVKKLDLNGDGKLDADELGKAEAKVKEKLLKKDKNGDGALDADEIKALGPRGEHGKGAGKRGDRGEAKK